MKTATVKARLEAKKKARAIARTDRKRWAFLITESFQRDELTNKIVAMI